MHFTNKTRLLLILHWCGANLLMVLGNDFPTIEDIIREIKVYFLRLRDLNNLISIKSRKNDSITINCKTHVLKSPQGIIICQDSRPVVGM